MSFSVNFPNINPTLMIDCVNRNSLDSRVTFTRGSTATFVNSSGVITTAAANVPRFDHNPSTLQPLGLLIEEQRTNSIRNNTMVGAVAGTPGTAPTNWNTTNIGLTREIVGTGTENGITYIDIRFSGTATSQFGNVQFETSTGAAASASQSWTASSYLKLVSGSLSSNISAVGLATYYYDSGGVFLSTSSNTLTISSSFSRYSLSVTTPASTGYIRSGFYFNAASASGSVIDFTLRIGLPQLEQGAFATSVIPTTTTALTRNADVASMTGTNFSSWYSASEGTLFADSSLFGSSVSRDVISISDNTSSNSIQLRWASGSQAQFAVTTGGASQASIAPSGYSTLNQFYRRAGAYKVNDFAQTIDGTLVGTDTSGTIPVVDRMYLGAGTSGTVTLSGYIRRIAYYNTRLTDAQLQALTT